MRNSPNDSRALLGLFHICVKPSGFLPFRTLSRQLNDSGAFITVSNKTEATSGGNFPTECLVPAIEGESGDQHDNSALGYSAATNAALSVASGQVTDVVIAESSTGDLIASKPIRPREIAEAKAK